MLTDTKKGKGIKPSPLGKQNKLTNTCIQEVTKLKTVETL